MTYFPYLWKNKSLEKHEDEQEGTAVQRVYFQSHAILFTVKDTADCGFHTYRLRVTLTFQSAKYPKCNPISTSLVLGLQVYIPPPSFF